MHCKGKNVVIKPSPREKVLKSGIIIPDTATPPSQEWGDVVDGNDIISSGSRVLYIGKKNYEEGDLKIVPNNKILYWNED